MEREKKREGEIETNSEDKFEPKPTKKKAAKRPYYAGKRDGGHHYSTPRSTKLQLFFF